MSTYLLTWNPNKWGFEEYKNYYLEYKKGRILRWSCGTTKKINIGDPVYLLKQGKGSKGIIGSGVVVTEPYKEKHYSIEGKTALYVDVKFEYLSELNHYPISREELDNRPDLFHKIWNSQGSGKTIPEHIVGPLNTLWSSRVELQEFTSPDEIEGSCLVEGAKKTIIVNAYERNPEARKKCIEKWGLNCSVCSFHFELVYGLIGKNYIHVHHLKPLAEVGKEYKVNPEEDLRPVCPNCHAMLHKEKPPLSIEELKKRLALYRK
ncbi:HNH endonuclease [Photobacterium leiognathi]|uniref:HNH endonuclease n=1 Tax=Photobacterium leiognathi TaxID=553611 RepID=UPI00298254AB|nr:HNH endonuclease [Photobacterium leiognathi]